MGCACASGRGVGARRIPTTVVAQAGGRPLARPFVSSPRRTRHQLQQLQQLQQYHQPSGSVATQAIFGVGAPEAILVGVVALVLFGPKGLAQAAKSLGQVVKSVAPTLRELTDISSDLKSTIEDEIGLKEIRDELESTLSPLSTSSSTSSSTSRSGAKPRQAALEEDPDIEAKRAASMKAAWGASESEPEDAGSAAEAAPAAGAGAGTSAVDGLSTEELERIIAARKASQGDGTNEA